MEKNVYVLNEERNVTLTIYLLPTDGEFRTVEKRPLVMVLPGGGYAMCSEREADPIAFPYMNAGYHTAILRYSVHPYATWPNPLDDYEAAMQMIKEHADDWKVYADKIAVIGFSAGGHLAAAAATMAVNRPQAALLGYAVTSEDVKGCNPTAPDTISQVDDLTPPCFLFHTRNDHIVPIMNSVKFMEALTEHDITYECHIYSHGPHGFATADTSVQGPSTHISKRVPNWVSDSIGWLREVFGDFDNVNGGLKAPEIKAHITSDSEPFLSVDCTMARIQGNPLGARIIGEMMEKMRGQAGNSDMEKRGDEMGEGVQTRIAKMTLRDILGFSKAPQAVIDALNEQLGKIPNI